MLNWSHKPQSGLALFHTSTSANCDQTAEFLFHFLPILLYPISASLNLIQSPKTLKQSPGVDSGGICLITSMIKNPTGQHEILWLKIRGKTGGRGGEVIFAQCNRRSDPVLAVFLIIKKKLDPTESLFFFPLSAGIVYEAKRKQSLVVGHVEWKFYLRGIWKSNKFKFNCPYMVWQG